MDLRPEVVVVRAEDGSEREVAIDDIEVGMIAIVRPGDRIPVDGTVVVGHSAVDQSAITGESLPRDKGPSDEVFAGSQNLTGMIEVEVSRVGNRLPSGDDEFWGRRLQVKTRLEAPQDSTILLGEFDQRVEQLSLLALG